MAQRTYDITLRVPTSKLATVIEVLDGEGELLSMQQTSEAAASSSKRPRAKTTPMRRRNGTTGAEILMETAKGGHEVTSMQFAQAFAAKGYSLNSASPQISKAVAEGKLVMIRKGVFKIAPKST